MRFSRLVLVGATLAALAILACSTGATRAGLSGRAPWSRSANTTNANHMTEQPLKLPLERPHILVKKGLREMELFDGTKLLRTYHVGLGFSPIEDKILAGDGRTPEGDFYVCVKNANSKFYLSLGISYPNIEDADRGLKDNLITRQQRDQIAGAINAGKRPPWDTKLGGEIFIHGNGSSRDWTWGCVAVEDTEIKELFDAVPMGARVRIEH